MLIRLTLNSSICRTLSVNKWPADNPKVLCTLFLTSLFAKLYDAGNCCFCPANFKYLSLSVPDCHKDLNDSAAYRAGTYIWYVHLHRMDAANQEKTGRQKEITCRIKWSPSLRKLDRTWAISNEEKVEVIAAYLVKVLEPNLLEMSPKETTPIMEFLDSSPQLSPLIKHFTPEEIN